MSFFKILIVFVSLIFCMAVGAQEKIIINNSNIKNDNFNGWANRSLGIMDAASKMEKPDWLQGKPTEQDMISAEKLRIRADVVRKNLAKGMDGSQATSKWVNVKKNSKVDSAKGKQLVEEEEVTALPSSLIFVSQSMQAVELTAAVEVSSETGAVLVFRGIKQNQAIDHIGKLVFDIVRKNEELKPAIVINPALFQQYDITSVPTAVVNLGGKTIKAAGTLSIDYLIEQLENNKQGNLGVIGPTHDIIEPDMIEELKRRALLVDWEAQKKGVVDKFWTESWGNFTLPVAKEDSAFLVDPSFTVKSDIVANGNVVVKAGTKVNPQKSVPLSQRYIFFDGTDERQKKVIADYIKANKLSYESTHLIITEMDRKGGFKAFQELMNYFGGNRIAVMEKGMKERFKIKAVPSILSGSGDYYKVQEIGILEK